MLLPQDEVQVMLDLETMGQGNDAAIVAIGAVSFIRGTAGVRRLDMFYQPVQLQSSVDAGGVIDPSTVLWWMKQSDIARAELLRRDAVDIRAALRAFEDWLPSGAPAIWGNGAGFDNVILASTYRRIGKRPPWTYRQDRCYRTVKAIYPKVELAFVGEEHNALADAIYQMRYLIELNHIMENYKHAN